MTKIGYARVSTIDQDFEIQHSNGSTPRGA